MKNLARLIIIIMPYLFCLWAILIGVNKMSPSEPVWILMFPAAAIGCFLATLSAHIILQRWER
jgi:hypothetical protein